MHSPWVAAFAGSMILWASFGIRQTFGVFLIPITTETGWSRTTFSIAAALLQLLWGFSQPFLVYLAERKFGFGKTIFISTLVYSAGCLILYASDISPILFIVSMGVIIGVGAGGNSFPNVLASVGRRLPQNSQQQVICFGIVAGFGSFGQCVFLPIAREMAITIGWRLSFIVLGSIVAAVSPLAYFLQTIPPTPPLPAAEKEKADLIKNKEEEDGMVMERIESVNPGGKAVSIAISEDDFSAPTIFIALREAFSSPTFLMITCGFTVCGFHVAFITTHFPAYLEDQGINPSFAAWTMSIWGFGSMLGSFSAGFVTKWVSPRIALMFIYFTRGILIVIFVFVPISIPTVVVFTAIFGVLSLSTVPLTTKFIGDVFGHKYLGTLTSITFVGHQIGAFLGAYLGGIVYDSLSEYTRMWYGSLALALVATIANFFAGEEPINMRRRGLE